MALTACLLSSRRRPVNHRRFAPGRVAALCLALTAAALVVPGELHAQEPFVRGDANADRATDLSDPIATLIGLFASGRIPCQNAADSNDDDVVDISDAVFSLNFLFASGPEIPPPTEVCGTDPTPGDLSCAAFSPCDPDLPTSGQTEFATPIGDANRSTAPGAFFGDAVADDAEAPAAPTPAAPAGESGAPERLIEEADIYKVVDQYIYVLNRYRGLQVIDLSRLDAPELIGRAPIFGYPREMYIRGNLVFAIVSDYYSYWREEGDIAPHGFYGSQLRIIDIADPTQPQVIGGINLEGDLSDSRIVGDVMYLVSNRYPWYGGYGTDDTEDKTQILSVSLSDLSDVRVIDSVDFPRSGWEHHIFVTAQAIYLSSSGWDSTRRAFETTVRYIDISDPSGDIVVRGSTPVPGRVQDRWSMDEHNGVFRVASSESWGNGTVYLRTYSVSDPDEIDQLGGYDLNIDERLTAARFDGDRAYLVTYRNIDPLFVFDVSDATRPQLLGELIAPGWMDFLVPLGDRIVALGHDDRIDPETGRRHINLAVSLVDVAGAPKLLSRVGLEGVWGWVPGDRDDAAKVFRVLEGEGLIVFPFQAWDPINYRSIGGVQLIDLAEDSLTLRGLIESALAERAVPHGENKILTLSNRLFQAVDITNRDEPEVLGSLELARNVQDFAVLSDDHSVQLSGDWYRGDTQVTVTPLDDPNTASPTSSLTVPAPYGRMFLNGDLAYVTSVRDEYNEEGVWQGRSTHVQVVDLSDPEQPQARGSIKLPEEVWLGYHSWYWGYGDEVVQVEGSTLAFHRFQYPFYDCLACDVAFAPEYFDPKHQIFLVDLSNPDEPALGETIELESVAWAWGLIAQGTTLYLSSYTTFVDVDAWYARYMLHRFDVDNPSDVISHPAVNIPGMLVDATPDGSVIYSLESRWNAKLRQNHQFLYALRLTEDDKAELASQVELPGDYINSVLVRGSGAFATTSIWETIVLDDGSERWQNRTSLVTIDLSDPDAIALAGEADVPFYWAYLQEVESGYAFVGSGAGIFVFSVEDLSTPEFERFFRTQGWSQKIVVHDNKAYVPSGFYGVQVLELESEAEQPSS